MDYLILCEKKSAMDNFVQALGGSSGEFDGHSYQIVHAEGHLLTLSEPEEQVADQTLVKKLKSWQPEDMPWPIDQFKWVKEPIDRRKQSIISQIKKASKNAGAIVIATDNDPSGEGELLAWEIINAIGWHGKVLREYHDDESPKAIRRAMEKLSDVSDQAHDGDYLKAQTRQRWDFASMQLTRLATSAARNAGYQVRVANQGRLKSYMLALVDQRLTAIKNYVKKPFYEVKYKDKNGHVFARKVPKDDEDALAKLHHSDKEAAKQELTIFAPSGISDVKTVKKTQAPGQLLDLAKLDAELAKKGYPSKLIETVYQELYQAGYVSYPRTEDKFITTEQFNELKQNREVIADLVGVDKNLLTHLAPRPRLVKDSATHGANRPGSKIPHSLDQLTKFIAAKVKGTNSGKCARDIYELLAKSALTMFGEDYVYEHTTSSVADHPEFVTSFNRPVKRNWKAILDLGEPAKDEDHKLVGQQASPFIAEGANPKPAAPTKSWVYKQLTKQNVGTGATQQSTMATITDAKNNANLLNDRKGRLSLTEQGKISAWLAHGSLIANARITAQLFQGMDKIGKYAKNPDDGIAPERVLATVNQVIAHDTPTFSKNAQTLGKIVKPKDHGRKPKSKDQTVVDGKTVSFNQTWGGHKFTEQELADLKAGKSITFSYKTKKGNRDITGKLGWGEYKGRKFYGFQPDFN